MTEFEKELRKELAGCQLFWTEEIIKIAAGVAEKHIDERLDAMDRFDNAEKQWYEKHLKDQLAIHELKEENEFLKIRIKHFEEDRKDKSPF